MIVKKGDEILLIERARFPFGFAIPAGHVDDDATYEDAARRELKEEVGLDAEELMLVKEGKKENVCRREDGTWHYWKIYEVIVSGKIERSVDETKQAGWYTREQIKELAERTERYNRKEIADEEWQDEPGLESVMYEWFKELGLL